ncbi:hypothetical protein CYMTET_45237 [Cymbomonas tetramitiformis]|uniref:Uncharacterized protein n=1 Tax=Cymbomonas tetramitiformis TaxID=36881 RepID=A0AAE0C0C7_9CHLO|nr:hypothetical protein CYMTET_45237 [Cymbomonas tetramitiformis]
MGIDLIRFRFFGSVAGGERDCLGRVGEGAREEGAVVIEYFDGNPAREEMFLEGGPRSLGEHDGHLVRRDSGGEVTVAEVDGWSAEAERDLLVGWRVLDQTGSGSAGVEREANGVGVEEAGGPIGPLEGTLGGVGGLVQPEGGGGQVREGQQAGTVVCSRAVGQARRQPMAGGLAGNPEGLGEAGWAWLRGLSIDECAVSDYPSLMVPKRLRGLFTECAMVALRRMRVDTEDVDAYKLFFLLPRLILQPVQKGEKKGVARVIKERCARFLRGDWEELHAEAPGDRRATAEADEERVLRDAVRLDDEHDGLRAIQVGVVVKGGADLGVHTAVLERVQERHPAVVICAYLDDAWFMGPPADAALASGVYMEEAAAIGLDIQPMKSAAFSPVGDTSCFADCMPGARGDLDFIDVLGVPVGKAEAVSAEMLKKVENLCAILPALNKLGEGEQVDIDGDEDEDGDEEAARGRVAGFLGGGGDMVGSGAGGAGDVGERLTEAFRWGSRRGIR